LLEQLSQLKTSRVVLYGKKMLSSRVVLFGKKLLSSRVELFGKKMLLKSRDSLLWQKYRQHW